MTLLGGRSREREILDRREVPDAELSRSLARVTEVNRLLGGVRSLRRHLAGLRGRDRVRLLDVGTGSADVLRDLLAWGEGAGGRWWGVGLDRSGGALRVADSAHTADTSGTGGTDTGGTAPRLVRGDGLRLPFRSDAFDAAVASLTLHHLADADAVALVAEMARVSRELVVISDLERSLPAWLGARVLAATRWRRDRITRHDGPLSVRRSFTREELESIGRRAGLRAPRVRRHFPFRLALVGGAVPYLPTAVDP